MALGGFAPLPLRLGGTAENGITAAQWKRICADLVSARRTSPFAVIKIDQNSNSPEIVEYRGLNGMAIDDRPTLTWNGAMTEIQWSSSYQDDIGRSVAVRVTGAKGTLHGSAAGGRVKVLHVYEPHIVRVVPVSFSGTVLSTAVYTVVVS